MKCIVCGRESERSICPECYVKRNSLVEVEEVVVEVCPRCGFYRIEGRWKDVDFCTAVEKSLKVSVHPDFEVRDAELSVSEEKRKGFILFRGTFWEKDVEQLAEFTVNVRKTLCKRCSREAGGYYESIVQLRAKNRKLSEEELEEAGRIVAEVLERERENLKAFLTKVVERREGIDYYIGGRDVGRKVAKRIAERFGGRITESKKIAGRRDGRDIYRFTYSVRLPEYRKGDVVVDENRVVYVTNPKLGKGISLPDMVSVNLKDARTAVKREEMEEGIVVNADSYAVEVVKESGELIMAEKAGKVSIGDSVKVFEYDGKHYVVPKELSE